jgi:UDP-2,4-diacetamido-2,4,6-trideoxy-beta-L-altropyranose hydrolase
MRIALRTDASRRIGTGHLRRCQSLAAALRNEGAQVSFLCRAHDEISRIAGEDGEAVLWLPAAPGYTPGPGDPAHADWAECGWERDADQTIAALRHLRPDWVLVDHYAFDARWHERVGSALACRIAVIDDLADRPLACALVIDQNMHPDHAAKYAPVLRTRARILGGPRYALLAPRYRTAPRYRFRRRVASVGIFMGGGDPLDFTSRVLRACREAAGFTGAIEVVSSSRNPNFQTHLALAQRWPHTHVLYDQPDLTGFFARHDLQIGSGGIAAWERCCLGAPTLALQIAPNQLAVLPELARAGAIEWLDRDDADEPAIGEAVRSLVDAPRRRLALARATRGLVDGRGAARAAAVLALAAEPRLELRAAAAHDEALLLDWANDTEARRHAFHTKQITPREHHAWFARRLSNPADSLILIASSPAGTPVGQARFERTDDAWTISYSLAAAFRGWGLARPLLSAAIDALRARLPDTRLEAWVKPDNVASLQTFRGMGFSETRAERDGMQCHRFELPTGTRATE